MKRCPKCSRTFPDDNQKFCTIDGGLLVSGDQPFDPNATIQGSANMAVPTAPEQPASNRPPDFNETIASAPTAVLPRQTGPTNIPTSSNLPQPPAPGAPPAPPAQPAPPPQASAPPPPPSQAARPPAQSAPLPPAQRAPAPPAAAAAAAPVAKKKSKLPLILGILALLLILGLGGAVAAFFLVIKPRLDNRNAEPPVVTRENPPENTNTNTNTNTNSSETKTPETTQPEFVAPPDTTKFTNSQANLDGKLAEHYFDFSFYYPNSWVPDPKAGVAGSGNFAKVERRLPPDFTQENFAVRFYESKGTYADDLPDFPKLVEQFSADLAKFPGYRQVSSGPTKVNSMDAYEFKWEGLSKGTEKGDLHLWGRVVFVPSGVAGDKNGAILSMFTTSLAPELSSVEDVGTRGEMPVILESFRFAKKP
jgi:hypothetical protein